MADVPGDESIEDLEEQPTVADDEEEDEDGKKGLDDTW